MRTSRFLGVLVAALLLVGTACGGDDGASVRDGGAASASGSGSGSGSGSTAQAECQPVGDASTATQTLHVDLGHMVITPPDPTVPAGAVNIVATNVDTEPHELVVIRGDDRASLPTDEHGAFDEEAFDAADVIGEIEPFPGGESCNGVFDLEPGSYLLLCNITEVMDDGMVESHFAMGMVTSLTVT